MQDTIKRRSRSGLRALLSASPKWFAAWGLAGLALRLAFVLRAPMVLPDSLVYGDIARNWLQRHVYGLTTAQGLAPTDIRLPGYPAFLAFWFRLAGVDHYGVALLAQAAVDLATCLVIALLAQRVARVSDPRKAGKWAFALAAVFPLTANYTAAALTETLAIFFAALAVMSAVDGIHHLDPAPPLEDSGAPASHGHPCPRTSPWILSGLAIAASILLRPDGGILLIAIGGYLLWRLAAKPDKLRIIRAGLLLGVCSLAPLIPWTIRNAVTLRVFQPLAPETATNPGEFYPYGFIRWERTWVADYASLEDIHFNVSGDTILFDALPARACDNDDERRRTAELFAAYNQTVTLTPALDGQFAELARERIRRTPLRYYLELPALRALDMWLRPPTQLLDVDVHWWTFDDPHDEAISLSLAALNVAVLAAAAWVFLRRRVACAGLLLGFLAVRTVIVAAIIFPEPRYMLECYPVVLAAAGVFLGNLRMTTRRSATQDRQDAAVVAGR
jgi:4-amino-4-deoxy-L-arabinose transferase-like glycosyltransferase